MRSHKSFKIFSDEKISNSNYKADIKHTLRYTRCFLGILGVWPLTSQNSTKIGIFFSKLLIIVCVISPAFILIPTLHYVILREKNMIARLMIFTPVGFFLSNFFKYIFIVFRCGMISLCVEHVRTDWMKIDGEKERATMKRNVKVGHDLTVMCSVFMYGCGLMYHMIMPLFSGKALNELNETVRPLVYPGFDTFVETQTSPTYEIIFCTICVSAFVSFTVTTATCNIAAVFVTHVCGQIQILILRLGSLVQDIDESEGSKHIQERISFVVRCHVRVLRLTSTIDVILREICLIEVVASTFTICLIEYCFMMELDNNGILGIATYFLSFISLCFNIYIFCHIGELLKEQYCQISMAAYMIEWYKLPGKLGLDIAMIIVMANSSRKLTAGSMMELSIGSFGTIIKMSMTYFNLLRRLTVQGS